MYVCMYACMHVRMYACMHACMYVRTYVCMYGFLTVVFQTQMLYAMELNLMGILTRLIDKDLKGGGRGGNHKEISVSTSEIRTGSLPYSSYTSKTYRYTRPLLTISILYIIRIHCLKISLFFMIYLWCPSCLIVQHIHIMGHSNKHCKL
jgi:hypothetical protein